MKKSLVLFGVILGSITILFGCNNTKKEEVDKTETKAESNSSNESSKSNTSEKNKSINDEINKSSNNIESKNSSIKTKNYDIERFLKTIKIAAENGKVIGTKFKIGVNIDDVISKLGQPSSKDYVEAAKGTYFTFKSKNMAVGCNKGDQVFEVRAFYSGLSKLNITSIEKFFGTPDYRKDTKDNERIIGYKINEKYKILFVFNIKDGKLKHYSVLNPSLTKNSMSGDSGREW